MMRILFVCLGNICRSPMAEYVMKRLAAEAGMADRFEIASAGTGEGELWGSPVYPQARQELARHGIACRGHASRLLTRADYGCWDCLIGMEPRNLRDMRRICGGDPEGKMRLLMSFAGSGEGIEDPWYTGRFSEVYRQIDAGCRALLDALTRQA